MKLSVFYDHILQAAEQTGRAIPDLLNEVSRAGIEAVEINMTYLREHEETLGLLHDAGLSVSCVYEFYGMEASAERMKALRHVKTAKKAGAGLILVVPGFLAEETADFAACVPDYGKICDFLNGNIKALRMAKGLSRITSLAKRHGITTVIEDFDHESSPISCTGGMRWFAERIPGLRFTFDTGNFIVYGEDPFSAWELMQDRVVHVHCKDRGQQAVAVGDGRLPMRELLGKIAASGYEGYYAIEHFDAVCQMDCIGRSAAFLRSIDKTEKIV